MKEKRNNNKQAFSLVELSIVLVILGLLVGGILGGKSLIRAAEMRATIQQLQQYEVALAAFRLRYHGVPGDIAHATRIWPDADGSGGARDGNANGMIEADTVTAAGVLSPDNPYVDGERAEFFRQLAWAGLIAGDFDGSGVIGRGYPAIKMHPDKGMFVSGRWELGGGSNIPDLHRYTTASIYMALMVCNPAGVNRPPPGSIHNDCGIFTPEELWAIDGKIDDGAPLAGRLVAHSFNRICVMGAEHAATAAYAVAEKEASCNAMYELLR